MPPKPVRLVAPEWLKNAGVNLARSARITIPGAPQSGVKTELLLNDGEGLVENNSTRWVHRGSLPHWIEFTWEKPVLIGAARIISGYHADGAVTASVEDFVFQWHDGAGWKDIPSASIHDNGQPAWAGTFKPVQSTKLRLGITATKDAISRIWEVELYGPVTRR
jgi:hypothetical protein